ncbi:hypothetical protein [Afipia birgiae]|uniref:hypothetical protein n=1 Tax=Afipia birgiae TaxID=151414 RepID=UPI001FCBFEC7|nr:hypothetical protein [Afipia birgiae]
MLKTLAKREIAMRMRSAGLAALVAAAGIWISFSGEPAIAAKTAKAAKTSVAAADRPIVLSKFKKQRAHAAKKSRTAQARQTKRAASKISSKAKVFAQKFADKPPAENKVLADANENELPVSVANARAQALADDEARNISALDSTDVVAGMQVAAADIVSSGNPAPENNTAVAQDTTVVAPAVSPPPTPGSNSKILRPISTGDKPVFKTDDSDPWNKTSLIGKIFIAFGSLLTLASAARLLIF